MLTAAQILRQTRKKKGLSLKEISQETKIPFRYLRLIERGQYHLLPEESYAKLYIRDYACFLGLSPDEVISFFRRDLSVDHSPRQRRLRDSSRLASLFLFLREKFSWRDNFSLSPTVLRGIGIGITVLLLAAYLLGQYLIFNSPPPGTVTLSCQKKGGENWVRVEGKTNKEATVRIGETPISVKNDGRFQEEVFLLPGQKEVEILFQSPTGRKRKITKEINCR